MNINKIFMISIILLTIITLGVASAADAPTDSDDALSLDNNMNLQESDDDIISEDEKEDWDMEVDISGDDENRVFEDDEVYLNTYDEVINEYNLSGNDFTLSIDNKNHAFIYDEVDERFEFNTTGLTVGKHDFTLKFLGNIKLNPASDSGSFEIVRYVLNLPDECIYGHDLENIQITTHKSMIGKTASITIDDNTKTEELSGKVYYERGYASFNYKDFFLPQGKHNVTVKIDDEVIGRTTINTDFDINLSGENIAEYGYDDIQLADIPGVDLSEIVVKIDGKTVEHYISEPDEWSVLIRVLTTPNITPGNHTITVMFPKTDKFPEKTFTGQLDVRPTLKSDYRIIDETDGLRLLMPDDAKGNLTIIVKGYNIPNSEYKVLTTVPAKGEVFIPLRNLTFGEYEYDYKYDGGDYKVYGDDSYFTVNPKIILPPSEINPGEDAFVSVNLPGEKGYVAIRSYVKEGEGPSYNLVDGKATGKVEYITSGLNRYFAELVLEHYEKEGDRADEVYYYDFNITVKPNITFPSEKIMLGEKPAVSVDLIGVNGTLLVMENVKEGEGFEANIVNGKANGEIPAPSAGKHTYYAKLILNSTDKWGIEYNHGEFNYTFDINVISPIAAKGTSVLYSANGNYKVTIKDINGKSVKSGKVTFYIMDGEKQIFKKTVNIKNGAATLSYKITQGVKTYTIKTEFGKVSVSKDLAVKHVVVLKSATVKKSAKKLILQASLKKVNGKYLKNKKVTFKFNGKTYKAKTNSKGVAKIIVKNTVLKKLKVGKKVTYLATYLKDTVKKTVKVKK